MPEEQQTTLPVGTLLRERYLIRSVLGSSNAGTLYLVRDQQTKDIKYQLFILKEITGLDQQARYQFTFSGPTLRQIRHPALPHVHHIFNDDKRKCVYLVMDYVEGTNLEMLRQQQPARRFSWSELRVLCEPLIGALIYLHHQEKPLFHGDIRPTNVIQSITEKITFIDLGYVQAVPPEHLRQHPAGVPSSYQAPEQFEGKIDELSDVYGLAAMLYALLTGRVPVDARTRRERIGRKKADPLVLASKVAPGVPRPLAEVLRRALSLDPAERFPSIREFWQELTSVPIPNETPTPVVSKRKTPLPVPITQVPGATPTPVGSVEVVYRARPAGEGASRRSLLPGIAILCALVLILIGVGAWWATTHGQVTISPSPSSQTVATGTPVGGSTTPTPTSVKYTSLLGIYNGNYNLISQQLIRFTLVINHQVQGQFSGTFDSPLQSGTITGKIDGWNDVEWTVIDSSNNAVLGFSGGLNGIEPGGILHSNDSMGGTFFKCKPNQGPNCTEEQTPGSGGDWVLNYVHSALVPSVSIWS